MAGPSAPSPSWDATVPFLENKLVTLQSQAPNKLNLERRTGRVRRGVAAQGFGPWGSNEADRPGLPRLCNIDSLDSLAVDRSLESTRVQYPDKLYEPPGPESFGSSNETSCLTRNPRVVTL